MDPSAAIDGAGWRRGGARRWEEKQEDRAGRLTKVFVRPGRRARRARTPPRKSVRYRLRADSGLRLDVSSGDRGETAPPAGCRQSFFRLRAPPLPPRITHCVIRVMHITSKRYPWVCFYIYSCITITYIRMWTDDTENRTEKRLLLHHFTVRRYK